MNWILLLYNLLLQGIAIFTLVTMFKLWQIYTIPFLKKYFVFVAGWSLFGFVIFFLQDVLIPIVVVTNEQSAMTLKIMMIFLIMPVTLVTVYFLVNSIFLVVGKALPRCFKIAYWVMATLFLVATTFGVEIFLRTGVKELLDAVYFRGFIFFNQLAIYFAYFSAHQKARGIRDPRMRSLALGWIRISGFIIVVYYLLLLRFTHISWILNALGIWFYLVVLAPVLFLRSRLQRDFADYRKVRAPVADIGKRAQELGLSPREAEIVARVMAGQSNREIEDELFISESTVKNHIYNIYRKLGVKNRVEMFRRFTQE